MKIKLNLFSISYILFSLYILGILIPFNQNIILFKNSQKELKLYSYFNYEMKYMRPPKGEFSEQSLAYINNLGYGNSRRRKPPYEDWDDDDEWERQEMKNLTDQIKILKEQKLDQEQKIRNSIFYLVLLGILGFILLLVIIIYCSIKCYILCSAPKNTDYIISKLSLNHLGEVYIGENGELRYKQSINRNSAAPLSANSGETRYNTFNPDNFISSEEDKKLYRPYDKEDIN